MRVTRTEKGHQPEPRANATGNMRERWKQRLEGRALLSLYFPDLHRGATEVLIELEAKRA